MLGELSARPACVLEGQHSDPAGHSIVTKDTILVTRLLRGLWVSLLGAWSRSTHGGDGDCAWQTFFRLRIRDEQVQMRNRPSDG